MEPSHLKMSPAFAQLRVGRRLSGSLFVLRSEARFPGGSPRILLTRGAGWLSEGLGDLSKMGSAEWRIGKSEYRWANRWNLTTVPRQSDRGTLDKRAS